MPLSRWNVIPIAALLLLAGCSSRQLIMPTSPAALVCVDACTSTRYTCRAAAQAEVDATARHCTSLQEHVENRCSHLSDERERQRCQSTNGRPPVCVTPVADTTGCKDAWELCALQCGAREAG